MGHKSKTNERDRHSRTGQRHHGHEKRHRRFNGPLIDERDVQGAVVKGRLENLRLNHAYLLEDE